MNPANTTIVPKYISGTASCIDRTGLLVIATLLAFTPITARSQGNTELQQKLATVKQIAAENQQKLRQYQWTETTQLTLNGEAKPPSQSMCMYGPDGTVQKTLLTPAPPPPSGGRMKQRIIEKKTGEMKDYMGQVKTLLAMYVPPNPQNMQQAFQSGKASVSPAADSELASIVFKDYAQPGDQMTITFNTATKKISTLNVNTYMDDPKDTVALAVKFASLPDATNYVMQSVLNAAAKKLQVTTTSTDYQRVGGQ
jgi:hypothetical protein